MYSRASFGFKQEMLMDVMVQRLERQNKVDFENGAEVAAWYTRFDDLQAHERE